LALHLILSDSREGREGFLGGSLVPTSWFDFLTNDSLTLRLFKVTICDRIDRRWPIEATWCCGKQDMSPKQALIPPERIEAAIFLIRGQKVMLDRDLAQLYEVATKVLLQAVKRNGERFPGDFLFQLSWEEA